MMRAVAADSALHSLLMEHVQGIADDCHASWRPEVYLESNQLQWAALNRQLLPGAKAGRHRMPYPFDEVLAVLRMELGLSSFLEPTNVASTGAAPHVQCAGRADSELSQALGSLSLVQRQLHVETAVLGVVHDLSGQMVDAETPLMVAGIDSLAATELSSRLQALVGADAVLSPTLIFEQPTSRAMARHLLDLIGLNASASSVAGSVTGDDPVSGAPHSNQVLYESTGSWAGGCGSVAGPMLSACGDAVGSIPAARWRLRDEVELSLFFETQLLGASHGSFLAGAHRFDNGIFGVSPAEAAAMDPQQRLLLERGYDALHGATLRRIELQGSDGGTFIGMEQPDWHSVKATLPDSIGGSFLIGDTVNVAAGRLSFVLDMHGPCKTVDTACSSGLCAAHGAVAAVRSSESAFAIAAAASLKLRPHPTLMLVTAGTVSVRSAALTMPDVPRNPVLPLPGPSDKTLRNALHPGSPTTLTSLLPSHSGRRKMQDV